MSAPALRPLGVGEILDVAIKITMRNWRTLVGLVALIVAPVQALSALVSLSLDDSFTGETDTFESADVGAYIAGALIVILLGFLSWFLSTAVAFRAVVEAYLGRKSDWRSCLRFVAQRVHSVLWVALLILVGCGLAAVLCLIPGIWLFVAWSVAMPALLTEDVRGVKALRRSFRLVRGRWWPAFALLLLGFLLTWIAGAIIQLVFGALFFVAESDLGIFLVSTLGGTVSSAVTTPFIAALITVLYVDLRVRKEGFDLQLLAERIGAAPHADDADGPLLLPPPGSSGGSSSAS